MPFGALCQDVEMVEKKESSEVLSPRFRMACRNVRRALVPSWIVLCFALR